MRKLFLVLTLLFSFAPQTVFASTQNFYFKSYDADYYLSRTADGASRLKVVETFTAVFPNYNQNHGITRVIPYTNQDGQNLTMASDRHLDLTIKHNGQIEKPYKVENGDGYFTVYVGDPDVYVRGEHTYELTYEFVNVITEFNQFGRQWQELYWDSNGNDWGQRFESLTVRLHLDPELKSAFTGDAWCYVGRYGTSNQAYCSWQETTDGLQFQATGPLQAGENLTFDLEFQPSTFVIPETPADYRFVVMLSLALAGTLLSLFLICQVYQKSAPKRKFYQGLFIKPEYAPPKNYSVAEMAAGYLGKLSLGNSKVATLLELATAGKIALIQHDSTTRFGRPKTTWEVKVNSLDLTASQSTMLKLLNGSASPLSLDQIITVKNRTSTATLLQLDQDFHKYAENSQLLDSKAKSPTTRLILLAVFWIFAFFIGLAIADETTSSYKTFVALEFAWLAIPLALGNIVALFTVATKLKPYFTHTEQGLAMSRYLDGLKLYIKMAEADRLKFLQSVEGADVSHTGIVKLYERLLPYAVLFRLEKSWLNELAQYYSYDDVSSPSWYVGSTNVFMASQFADSITSATRSVSTSTSHSASSGSSSGSSGGGGGGFSGGGGGGGGGGGW